MIIIYPLGQTPIQQGCAIMTYCPQHPPKPAGKRPAALVINDYLLSRYNSPFSKFTRKYSRLRQWMAASFWGDLPGKIIIQMCVYGPGNMSQLVIREPPISVSQVKPAVKHLPVWVVQVASQHFDRYQGIEWHSNHPPIV